MGRRQQDDRHSRSIGTLISLLVRCPEIGTVRYDPRQQTLRYSLLITGIIPPAQLESTVAVLTDTLHVYNRLDQREIALAEITAEEFGGLVAITVARDTTTISPAEVWTVLEFFRDRYGDRLVAEPVEYSGEEELQAQDEMIAEVLLDIQSGRSGRNLIAIREEGRVMVFQR